MLFHPLDGILGSTAKIRILRALLPLATPVSGREAQKLARIRGRMGASTALEDLSRLGVLKFTVTRGSHLYELNRNHELITPLLDLFSAEEKRLSALIGVIRQTLSQSGLEKHVRSLILYGSNVRGEAKPGSDVDLLVVVNSESAVDRVTEAMYAAGEVAGRTQGVRISPYVVTATRARERAKSGDPLLETVRREGRLLMGRALEDVVA